MIQCLWPTCCYGDLVAAQSEETAFSHGEVAALVSWSVQGVFDATQEVVGLEDEDQLAWDGVKQLCDLWKVVGNVILDCIHLSV